jgi:hypothetical protein
MSDEQLRDRLDESIAIVLNVSDKYVANHRGPSAGTVMQLANITTTLLQARALIPAALSEGETT